MTPWSKCLFIKIKAFPDAPRITIILITPFITWHNYNPIQIQIMLEQSHFWPLNPACLKHYLFFIFSYFQWKDCTIRTKTDLQDNHTHFVTKNLELWVFNLKCTPFLKTGCVRKRFKIQKETKTKIRKKHNSFSSVDSKYQKLTHVATYII